MKINEEKKKKNEENSLSHLQAALKIIKRNQGLDVGGKQTRKLSKFHILMLSLYYEMHWRRQHEEA